MFTEEQVWRMRAVLSGTGCRKELYYAGAILDANETFMPSSQRTTEAQYACNDGICSIDASYVNDGSCDCSECDDEDDWTCDTCGGCPTSSQCQQGYYAVCSDDDDDSGNVSTPNVFGYLMVALAVQYLF